jgi:hypothetical protein
LLLSTNHVWLDRSTCQKNLFHAAHEILIFLYFQPPRPQNRSIASGLFSGNIYAKLPASVTRVPPSACNPDVLLVVLMINPAHLFGWSAEGHQTVALIARQFQVQEQLKDSLAKLIRKTDATAAPT